MLENLTRCMRYSDDLSATQLLVRRMGHLRKGRLAKKSEDCAKCVRVWAGRPVSAAIGCLEKLPL